MNDKPKGPKKLITLLFVLLGLSFGLWLQAYSKGAVATPPAILIFGPQQLVADSDVPLRIMAIDALKRQRLKIAHFDLSAPGLSHKLVTQGDSGRLDGAQMKDHGPWQIDIAFQDREWSIQLPLLLTDSNLQRAFDGFQWKGLQTDYAAQLSAHELTFYPIWGSVSSSLSNPGISFRDDFVLEESIAPHPATVLDPQGYRMVLDRKGYSILGPLRVAPQSLASYQIRSNDIETYYVQAWLNEAMVDMKEIKISEGQAEVTFTVPKEGQRDDVFWVSITSSPWLDAQGEAFLSRVDTSKRLKTSEQLTWLSGLTVGSLERDPLQEWLRAHPKTPLLQEALIALQSRAVPPFYQAPLVSTLPKSQMLAFESEKAAELKKWRFPFRCSSLILCFFALIWVRREVLSHMAWKKTMNEWAETEPELSQTAPRSLKERIPWHNLWGLLAFLFICALFWGADWVLGLTLNDYRI